MNQSSKPLSTDWVAEALDGVPAIVTSSETMRVLRIGRRQLYRLVATGRLRALRRVHSGSSRLMIPRAEVERYLRSLEGDT